MRFSDLRGVILTLAATVATLWLGVTNKLNLYIHPRYITFAMISAGLALLLSVFGSKYGGDGDEPPTAKHSPGRVVTLALCVFGVLALLAGKPAVLTSAAATQRGVNAAAVSTAPPKPADSPLYGSNDYSNLSVKDWAGLLGSADDPGFFVGKNVDVVGFVTANHNDPKNVFYVSRFVITCCAVDARPVGLPVYMPDWSKHFAENQWVHVVGKFDNNSSSLSLEPIAVVPSAAEQVPQPEQVYEY